MIPTSRPVKLACLACRASKTRCDGQQPCANCSIHREECRYQPSRRGGARRGPAAAQKLGRKRAQRREDIGSISNQDRFDTISGQGYHLNSHPTAGLPVAPPSLSRIELDPRNSSIGFPSPSSGFADAQEPLEIVDLNQGTIRAYRCDRDLINAYYIFIHPYFPCLPPPAVPQHEDVCEALSFCSSNANPSLLPYWPTSPLGLALAAILVLIPPPGKPHAPADDAAKLRRSYADLLAQSALESLEDSLEPPSRAKLATGPRSTLHPDIPRNIEPVLALGLLSLYECCHRGNILKMRLRANQALTVAIGLSLHTENPRVVCLDAQRRCWWATNFLVYLSSIMNSAPPIVTFDDPRITTAFPEFRGCQEPWPLFVNAQEALLRSCRIARQLITENNDSAGLPRSLGEEIRTLDSLIIELATEADRFRCVTNYQGPEADASRNLWAISHALIHTARIALHRVRAFPNPPVFLDERCDFLAVDGIAQSSSSSSRPAPRCQLSPGRIADINALFPLTEESSVRICLHSALVVSRIFRRIPSPNPTYSDTADVVVPATARPSRRPELASPRSIPYMACFQLQSLYALAMVLWQVRTAMCFKNLNSCSYLFDRPSIATEVQDAERLVEELRYGVEALERSIRADGAFEGVKATVEEVERVYGAIVVD